MIYLVLGASTLKKTVSVITQLVLGVISIAVLIAVPLIFFPEWELDLLSAAMGVALSSFFSTFFPNLFTKNNQ